MVLITHKTHLCGGFARPEAVTPRNESRFQETRPDALEAACMFRVEGVVAADTRMFQHLAIVR